MLWSSLARIGRSTHKLTFVLKRSAAHPFARSHSTSAVRSLPLGSLGPKTLLGPHTSATAHSILVRCGAEQLYQSIRARSYGTPPYHDNGHGNKEEFFATVKRQFLISLGHKDARVRIAFRDRLEKYKNLKRKTSNSRLKLLRDCEGLFNTAADGTVDERTQSLLLHLVVCADVLTVEDVEAVCSALTPEYEDIEGSKHVLPVTAYTTPQEVLEKFLMWEESVHGGNDVFDVFDGYIEDSEEDMDEEDEASNEHGDIVAMASVGLESFDHADEGENEYDPEEAEAAALSGFESGSGSGYEGGSEAFEGGFDGQTKPASAHKWYFVGKRLARRHNFYRQDLDVKCAACGYFFLETSQLFLIKSGHPIHLVTTAPEIRERLLFMRSTKPHHIWGWSHECLCPECSRMVGLVLRTFDGSQIHNRIALSAKSLLVESRTNKEIGSLFAWKAITLKDSVGRKIRREHMIRKDAPELWTIAKEEGDQFTRNFHVNVRVSPSHKLLCSDSNEEFDKDSELVKPKYVTVLTRTPKKEAKPRAERSAIVPPHLIRFSS